MTKQLYPIHLFDRGWISSGDKNQTYGLLPYSRPLEFARPTPDFVWLDSVSPALAKVIDETSTLFAEENELKSWPAISKEINQRKLQLPNTFALLIESPKLQKKIPTCTACFLSLSEELIPVPGVSDHFLLRFLNDSQSCFLWYLFLSAHHAPYVVASPYFFDPDIFKAMEYEDVTRDELVSKSYLCAETFLEFIFRFWLENTVWYAECKKLELSDMQQAYKSSGYANRF